jgi:hypothetical protein
MENDRKIMKVVCLITEFTGRENKRKNHVSAAKTKRTNSFEKTVEPTDRCIAK